MCCDALHANPLLKVLDQKATRGSYGVDRWWMLLPFVRLSLVRMPVGHHMQTRASDAPFHSIVAYQRADPRSTCFDLARLLEERTGELRF